jgi:polyhydroxybutyrate depolymerase
MSALRPWRRAALAPVAAALAFALAGPASAATAPTACASPPVAGTYNVTVTSGGLQRTALVHVPAALPAGAPAPLLLALHGAYGNGPGMQTYSGFSALADADDFIVAYPSAAGHFWNISGSAKGPDDVAFIRALISTLESTMCIDTTRVFAAGVSNGAGMVALLGCALSSQIDGIAVVAGDYDQLPSCRLKRPVPLLEIHGTADRVAPYRGKLGQATVDGVPPFVAAWARRDGCAALPGIRSIASRTVLFRWQRCAHAATVEHIRIIAGRHQWPGATPPDPGPRATISASHTIWSFFSSLGPQTLPPASGAGGTGGAPA